MDGKALMALVLSLPPTVFRTPLLHFEMSTPVIQTDVTSSSGSSVNIEHAES
jgi:hypothetical protein